MRVACLMILTICSGCSDKPQEARVRELIAQVVKHAELGQSGDLLELTTPDFRTTPHGVDRKKLRLRLRFGLQRFRNGTIHYPRPSVELSEGDTLAEVSFPFLTLKGHKAETAAGEQDETSWMEQMLDKARVMRIILWLRLVDDDWLIYQARLERFSGVRFTPVK
jgi:hypothetical protein